MVTITQTYAVPQSNLQSGEQIRQMQDVDYDAGGQLQVYGLAPIPPDVVTLVGGECRRTLTFVGADQFEAMFPTREQQEDHMNELFCGCFALTMYAIACSCQTTIV